MRSLMILQKGAKGNETTPVTFVTNNLNKNTNYVSQNGFSFTLKGAREMETTPVIFAPNNLNKTQTTHHRMVPK